MKTTNIMIVGVGGQGSLLASKLLGNLFVSRGLDVKVSEVHGMSQRGGSVVTYVRVGKQVYSPIISTGEADYIVSFEKLEAARALFFRPDSLAGGITVDCPAPGTCRGTNGFARGISISCTVARFGMYCASVQQEMRQWLKALQAGQDSFSFLLEDAF